MMLLDAKVEMQKAKVHAPMRLQNITKDGNITEVNVAKDILGTCVSILQVIMGDRLFAGCAPCWKQFF